MDCHPAAAVTSGLVADAGIGKNLAVDPSLAKSCAQSFARVKQGDSVALRQLLQVYMPRLRAFVHARMGEALRRFESEEDLVQSVCRGLIESENSLSFDNEGEFRAWLFTASRNKVYERARYWKREKRAIARHESVGPDRKLEELTRGWSGVWTPSRVAAGREELLRFEAALEQLADDHREVIALTRIAGLSYEQAGEALARSPEAVRKLLGRALRELAAALRDSA